MDSFRYFAYGSNMLTERLQNRCPSARPVGTGLVRGFSLCFHKRSVDRSGKALLAQTGDSERFVYGVLFEIAQGERGALDKAEGLGSGYERDDAFNVRCSGTGELLVVTTYHASPDAIDPALEPYDWYLALVMAGAMQHGLPALHLDSLQQVPQVPDTNEKRPSRLDALRCLEAAGYAHLVSAGS